MRKLAVVVVVVLSPLAANADLIRVDITGVTAAVVERRGHMIPGNESALLPFGTPFSGYFVYDSDVPPFLGICEDFTDAVGCDYDAMVDAKFYLGSLEEDFDKPEPNFEGVTVSDAIVGTTSNFDAITWVIPIGPPNTVGEVEIRWAVNVLFQDSTNTAVTGNELPLSWELGDFDTAWISVAFWNHPNVIGTIETLKFTTVPEPGTLALFGIGLAGMGLMRRRKEV